MFLVRDAAHYYWPLYEYLNQEFLAGHVPLWNAFENGGQPLAADITCAAFYPGKLFLALPLPYDWLYKAYIVGHLVLAGWAAWALARNWQCDTAPAAMAALAYAGSGTILFQYANVVYLVGAAWLPLALLAGDRMMTLSSPRWATLCGTFLSMQVLGGDPQAAYNSILALALLLGLRLFERHEAGAVSFSPGPGYRFSGVLLLQAIVVCGLLSAVQVFLSAEYGRRSDRAISFASRSVYEGFSSSELFSRPAAGSHHEAIYDFSCGPWRLAEMVWPNVSGRIAPIHRRWLQAMPCEQRAWTPSLYFGLAPLVLALSGFRLRNASLPIRWMSWLIILGVVGSWGYYGLGFLAEGLASRLGAIDQQGASWGPAVGGLYWFQVTFLPGYVYFRYPAKLLVFAALGLSLLAAFAFQRMLELEPSQAFRRTLVALAGASLIFGTTAWLANAQFVDNWLQVPGDELFGPFDAAGALADLGRSFFHTALVAAMWLFLFTVGRRWNTHRRAIALLLLVGCDIVAAHWSHVPTAPLELWREPNDRLAFIEQGRFAPRLARAMIDHDYPQAWENTSDAERLRQGVRHEVNSLLPKYNLRARVPVTETYGLAMPGETALLFAEAHVAPDGMGKVLRQGAVVDSEGIWRKADIPAAPAASLAYKIECLEPIASSTWYERKQNAARLVARWARKHDILDKAPIVELSHSGAATRELLESLVDAGVEEMPPSGDSCRIVKGDVPETVELEVKLSRPALVVVREAYDPNWKAWVREEDSAKWRPIDVLRVDGMARGVVLPAGEFQLYFAYRPPAFILGAGVSIAAWLSLAIVGARSLAARRRPSPHNA